MHYKNRISERQKKKEKQMIEDYPEVIGKLTLYLGAGMTVKKAWKDNRRIHEGKETKMKIRI